jgi:hypothetical protein
VADTEFDGEAIRKLGSDLQNLIKDYQQKFADLDAHRSNAGKFATAVELEKVVGDRRNAVVQHGARFNNSAVRLGSSLNAVGTDFPNADGENARKIGDTTRDDGGGIGPGSREI